MDQLEKIKPTIFKTINNYRDSYIDHNFTMIDIRGQEIFLQRHLEDEALFKNLRTIIFVIEVQNEKKSTSTQKYLKEILDIIRESEITQIFDYLEKAKTCVSNLIFNFEVNLTISNES